MGDIERVKRRRAPRRKRMIGPLPPSAEAVTITLTPSTKKLGRSIKIETRADISIDVSADIVSHVFFSVTKSMIGKANPKYPQLLSKWSVNVEPKTGTTRAIGIASDRSADAKKYFRQRLRKMIKYALNRALNEWAPVLMHTRKT